MYFGGGGATNEERKKINKIIFDCGNFRMCIKIEFLALLNANLLDILFFGLVWLAEYGNHIL